MTAPALVMLARGSSDPAVAQVTHQLVNGLSTMRPDLLVRAAFLQQNPPSPNQVVEELFASEQREMVLVPLLVTNAVECDPEMVEAVARITQANPDARISLARPIGPEANLLSILDQRLRASLSQARCLELDGLVLSTACGGDVRGAALLARRARQWATHHRLPCLTAVADESGPSVAQAIMSLRAQGRRHIAVGSFFLDADDAYHQQSDLAYRYGAVSVSEPIGATRELVDIVLARYAFAAMELLDFGFDLEDIGNPPEPHLRVVGA